MAMPWFKDRHKKILTVRQLQADVVDVYFSALVHTDEELFEVLQVGTSGESRQWNLYFLPLTGAECSSFQHTVIQCDERGSAFVIFKTKAKGLLGEQIGTSFDIEADDQVVLYPTEVYRKPIGPAYAHGHVVAIVFTGVPGGMDGLLALARCIVGELNILTIVLEESPAIVIDEFIPEKLYRIADRRCGRSIG